MDLAKKHHAVTFSVGTGAGISSVLAYIGNTAETLEACVKIFEFIKYLI